MRGSKRTGLQFLLALCSCLALTGCTAQWKFVFINDDAERLLVRVGDTEAWIAPGERWRTPVPYWKSEAEGYGLVTVKDASDELLHSIAADTLFRGEPKSEYPNHYVRVTRAALSKISEATAKRLPKK